MLKNDEVFKNGQVFLLASFVFCALVFRFFYPSLFIFIFPLVVVLPFTLIDISDKVVNRIAFLIAFLIITWLSITQIHLLYSVNSNSDIVLAISGVLIIVLTLVTQIFFRFQKIFNNLIIVIFALCSLFIIGASPKPKIDTFELLNNTSKSLFNLVSPYNNAEVSDLKTYEAGSEVYKVYKENKMDQLKLVYSPLIVFVSAVGYFLGDVRIAFIIVLTITLFLISRFSILKNQNTSSMMIGLLSISSFFLIEQCWTDCIPFLFLICVLYLYIEKKNWKWLYFCIGLMVHSKLYMITALVFIMHPKDFIREPLINFKKIFFVFIGFIVPFVLMSLFGLSNIIHYLQNDFLFAQGAYFSFSNGFYGLFLQKFNMNIKGLSHLFLFLVILYYVFKVETECLIKRLSWFVFGNCLFFIFFVTFFYNYAWIFFNAAILMKMLSSSQNEKGMNLTSIFYILTRSFALFTMPIILSDISYYGEIGSKLVNGNFPYLDFAFEYPPLALFPIFISGKLTFLNAKPNLELFRFIFMLIMVLADLVLYKIVTLNKSKNMKFLYILISTMMLPYLFERLDIMMMLFFALGLVYLKREKFFLSAFWITIGGWYKLMPFLTSSLISTKNSLKKMGLYMLILNISLLILALYFFGFKLFSFFSYHLDRPLQIESVMSSIVFIMDWLFGFGFSVTSSHGSQNIVFANDMVLKSLLSISLVAFIAMVVWKNATSKNSNLLVSAFILMLSLIVFSKVFSTQYLIWLLPLYFLIDGHQYFNKINHLIFLFITIFSLIIFLNYWDFVKGDLVLKLIIIMRNILISIFLFRISKIFFSRDEFLNSNAKLAASLKVRTKRIK